MRTTERAMLNGEKEAEKWGFEQYIYIFSDRQQAIRL